MIMNNADDNLEKQKNPKQKNEKREQKAPPLTKSKRQ